MRPELAENDVHPKEIERETARHGGPRKVLGLRRPVGRPLPQCPGPAEPPTTHAAREGKETDRSDRAAGVPGGRFGDRRISTSHGAALAVAGRYVLVTVPSRRAERCAKPMQVAARILLLLCQANAKCGRRPPGCVARQHVLVRRRAL